MGTLGEMLRFGAVGCTAVAIQYGIYLLALNRLGHNAAFSLGYAVSFAFNYVATLLFTFRVKSNKRRIAGFIASHAVNFVLQNICLNLFVWAGMSKEWAMLPVLAICVPTNFLLVRHIMKERRQTITTKK